MLIYTTAWVLSSLIMGLMLGYLDPSPIPVVAHLAVSFAAMGVLIGTLLWVTGDHFMLLGLAITALSVRFLILGIVGVTRMRITRKRAAAELATYQRV